MKIYVGETHLAIAALVLMLVFISTTGLVLSIIPFIVWKFVLHGYFELMQITFFQTWGLSCLLFCLYIYWPKKEK